MIVAALVSQNDAWRLLTDAVTLAIFETLDHLIFVCAFLESLKEFAARILHAFGTFFKLLIQNFYVLIKSYQPEIARCP